jgi:hypothetical protein
VEAVCVVHVDRRIVVKVAKLHADAIKLRGVRGDDSLPHRLSVSNSNSGGGWDLK